MEADLIWKRTSWHIAKDISLAGCSLGPKFEQFQTGVSKLLLKRFKSTDEFENFLVDMLREFNENVSKKAHSFLTNLYEIRGKACRTHTCYHFTANATSTQRGEGTNFRLKGRGELKKELKNSDLVRAVERIILLSETRDSDSINIQCRLITTRQIY